MYISRALAAGDCLPFHKLTVIDQIYSNIDNIWCTKNLLKITFFGTMVFNTMLRQLHCCYGSGFIFNLFFKPKKYKSLSKEFHISGPL